MPRARSRSTRPRSPNRPHSTDSGIAATSPTRRTFSRSSWASSFGPTPGSTSAGHGARYAASPPGGTIDQRRTRLLRPRPPFLGVLRGDGGDELARAGADRRFQADFLHDFGAQPVPRSLRRPRPAASGRDRDRPTRRPRRTASAPGRRPASGGRPAHNGGSRPAAPAVRGTAAGRRTGASPCGRPSGGIRSCNWRRRRCRRRPAGRAGAGRRAVRRRRRRRRRRGAGCTGGADDMRYPPGEMAEITRWTPRLGGRRDTVLMFRFDKGSCQGELRG